MPAVPDWSRRRLLVGALGAGTTSLVIAPRTWYPTWLVDRLIGRRDVPNTEWYPPIPDAVVDEGRERLTDALERADALWDRIDDERYALPKNARSGRTYLSEAHDRADELEGANPDRETRFSLHRALGRAGFAIGAGQLALDEHDADALFQQGERLRSEIDAVHDTLTYTADDPSVALAFYARIEDRLYHALVNSHRNGFFVGDPDPPEKYRAYDVPRTWRSHLQAELDLLDARHTSRAFDERRSEPDESLTAGLETLFESFDEEVERSVLTNDEANDEIAAFEDDVYTNARWRLYQTTHGGLHWHRDDTRPTDLARSVVRYARNVCKLRAYSDAVDRLPLKPGADPDPATVYKLEKRVAERLRETIDEYDSPLFRLLADEATRRVRTVGTGLPGGPNDEAKAQARADALVSLTVADAELRHVPTVYETILERLE